MGFPEAPPVVLMVVREGKPGGPPPPVLVPGTNWGTKPRSPAGSGGGAACDTARLLEEDTEAKWAGRVEVQNSVSSPPAGGQAGGQAKGDFSVVGSLGRRWQGFEDYARGRGAARVPLHANRNATPLPLECNTSSLTRGVREDDDVPQRVALPLLGCEALGRHAGGGVQQALLVQERDQHHAFPVRACRQGGKGRRWSKEGNGCEIERAA